jgi:hypothetical protein
VWSSSTVPCRVSGNAESDPTRSAASRRSAHIDASELCSYGIARFLLATKSSRTSSLIRFAYFLANAFEPRTPVPRKSLSSVASSPSKATNQIGGASLARFNFFITRAISSICAVPPAPSLAPTKSGMSLVS